jgi:hypothetical protein
MAVFGRRQPHAPIILSPTVKSAVAPTFLAKSPVIVGQGPSQQAARRPVGTVILRRLGSPKPVTSPIITRGLNASQATALASRRPAGRIQIIRGGGRSPIARIATPTGLFAAQTAAIARKPTGRVRITRKGLSPPVGKSIAPRGQNTAQAAALAARSPFVFKPIIRGLIQYRLPRPPVASIPRVFSVASWTADTMRRRPGWTLARPVVPPTPPPPPSGPVVSVTVQFALVQNWSPQFGYVQPTSPEFVA